ncbi:MAG: SpoIIE family protein phosphatase [Flavobacteriales bacterium]|nr:SpoIIE family protein phosphatase [Flavobacteriales bacterium]
MKRAIAKILFATICTLSVQYGNAQDYASMLSDMQKSKQGQDRAQRLLDLSIFERGRGHYSEAVEFAILGSAEAERNGLESTLAQALIELAEAHRATGDLDNAIGASIRATMINGTFHSNIRTNAMVQLAELYLESGHPQKALEHLEEAKTTTGAGKMDRSRYIRADIRARAMVMKPDLLITYCQDQRNEVNALADRELMLDLLSTLATAQAKVKQNQAALDTEVEVMKLAVALDKTLQSGICANNMGELNQRLGRNEEAMIAFGKGLILVEDVPYLRLSVQVNAAHAQATGGNMESAVRLIEEADIAARANNFTRLMPRLLRTKAAIQLLRSDLVSAQNTALEALTFAEEDKDLKEQSVVCDLLANIFEQRDLLNEARSFNKKARDLEQKLALTSTQTKTDRDAQLLRLQRIEREQVDLLNREQRKEGRLKQLALDAENREKQMALLVYEKQLEEAGRREEMILREKAYNELQLAQATLQDVEQQREIESLNNSRMLQALNVSKMEFEQKAQESAMDVLTQRNELVEAKSDALLIQQKHDASVKRFSLAAAICAALLAMYMARAWNITRKKNRTIHEQNTLIQSNNDELAVKSQNIQSSLDYAQTIQSAILTTETDLRNTIPDSFLLYKPLETVSGDLPFLKRIGNKVFVAAIDCTGHGVPAAMMTFIAYYGLSELLAQNPNASCGVLLDLLHEHVKKTMDARGHQALYNDGFDIGLCSLDMNTGKLSFSGAQLPLIVIRNGEVIRIKGDVYPLGDSHFKRNKGYRHHEMQLVNGDAMFLFSDGLIHQFGGVEGHKKFSMQRLVKLLANTAHMDLLQVKDHTEREFMAWKGNSPQTDDVLLLGLRYAA